MKTGFIYELGHTRKHFLISYGMGCACSYICSFDFPRMSFDGHGHYRWWLIIGFMFGWSNAGSRFRQLSRHGLGMRKNIIYNIFKNIPVVFLSTFDWWVADLFLMWRRVLYRWSGISYHKASAHCHKMSLSVYCFRNYNHTSDWLPFQFNVWLGLLPNIVMEQVTE